MIRLLQFAEVVVHVMREVKICLVILKLDLQYIMLINKFKFDTSCLSAV